MSFNQGEIESKLCQVATDILAAAKKLGAKEAEVDISESEGFSITARNQDVESLEFHHDRGIGITVYFGDKKGSASTTDLNPASWQDALSAACHIAKETESDPCNGLADSLLMAKKKMDLDLYHEWDVTPSAAIEQAISCEGVGLGIAGIIKSEGASVTTGKSLGVYANSHGFLASLPSTRHSASLVLLAKDQKGMQRDYDYTVARDPKGLVSLEQVAKSAAQKTLSRLDAKSVQTGQYPVLFSADTAVGLLRHFFAAISGGSIYRNASFLIDQVGERIFPEWFEIVERPHLIGGLASSYFDSEGVATYDKTWIQQGVLTGYVLSTYSARRLGLTTTANAGGLYNVEVKSSGETSAELLKKIGKGLLVTELMGQGVNKVTGDYSRGATGFWIENGEIQHAVEGITIACNLKDMFQKIVAVGSELETRSSLQTGPILVSAMTVAGE